MAMHRKVLWTYSSADGKSNSTLGCRYHSGFYKLADGGIFQRNHVTLQNAV